MKKINSLNLLIKEYLPIIKKIAYQFSNSKNIILQNDDLIQAGLIGLIKAFKDFDKSKKTKFKNYATLRIRGNIIDELRANDWHSRNYFKQNRKHLEAQSTVNQKLGQEGSQTEIIKAMNIDQEQFIKFQLDHAANNFCELDEQLYITEQNQDPFNIHYYNTIKEHLCDCINQLKQEEKQVISLYFHQNYSLKEIGNFLEISESRVCQINKNALNKIRKITQDQFGTNTSLF